MSKKADKFIDKYIVGKDDWLLKHKDVISKLLDEYETEQLTVPTIINSGKKACPDCRDRGWLYDEEGRRTRNCPCHYL